MPQISNITRRMQNVRLQEIHGSKGVYATYQQPR